MPGLHNWSSKKPIPGTTAMFFAGCGADQNPLPRGNVGFARQYGKALAGAVAAVVEEPMQEAIIPFINRLFKS